MLQVEEAEGEDPKPQNLEILVVEEFEVGVVDSEFLEASVEEVTYEEQKNIAVIVFQDYSPVSGTFPYNTSEIAEPSMHRYCCGLLQSAPPLSTLRQVG